MNVSPLIYAFAAIGLAFGFASLICGVIPGLAFHVYFGTTKGADKWHKDSINKRSSELEIK